MNDYVSHISVNDSRWALKIGSAQIGTQNFQNHEITGKHPICSKQLKLKGNKEKYIYLN